MRLRIMLYEVFVVSLWAVILPSALVLDAGGGAVWRGAPAIAVAATLGAFGVFLIDRGARELAAADIGLFGVRPGDRLVTSGVYGRIRNPIDVGSTAVAISAWTALDVTLVWVIPAAAIISAVAGAGPYEDRLLLEAFDGDFADYRRSVSKWVPRSR
jgi:protein-S-isoprenylcysteine O-methyltransferase Ste14